MIRHCSDKDHREREAEAFALTGVDEAGRGPLAGPVVAGACIIPCHVQIDGIRDSKQMTAAQRQAIYSELVNHPEIQCAT